MSASSMRFGDLAGTAARRWPENVAFSFRETRLTFRQLDEQVDRAARALLARGIRKGDVVGIWMTNRLEFPIVFFAAMRIGAVVAPMNTRYREHDVAFALKLAECKLLFVVERSGPVDYAGILNAVVPGFGDGSFMASPDFPHLSDIVVVSDGPRQAANSWDCFLAEADSVTAAGLADAASSVATTDLALIVFTSGTTGSPKGVMHDHSIVRNILERHETWPIEAGDAVLAFLPMFHLFGMSDNMIAGLLIGTHQILMDIWDAEEALRLVETERAAGLYGFETHYADILRAQERRGADLSSLRFGGLPAGMPNSNAVAAVVQTALCPTVSGWGMSETGCFVFMSDLGDTQDQRCTTSGRPMAGLEVRIADPVTGAEQPVGVEGEILARGYTIMRGYFRDPDATARTIDADGWLHSGDRGFLRPDGFLQFIGRYKEMLKVGGENVSPAALEQELLALVPSIEQVAIVGVPHSRLMEVACAYVVPKAGMACSLEDVQARCKGKIASFKIPHHVVVVDNLPMTASGKVQRVSLRDRAMADLALG